MTKNIGERITIIISKEDKITQHEQVNWAIEQLVESFENKWFRVNQVESRNNEDEGSLTILVQSDEKQNNSESFSIELSPTNKKLLFIKGSDTRGIVYALLEISDIVKFSDNPLIDLLKLNKICEQPANQIRSVKRLFVNEKTDKQWFYNKAFWREYLTELVYQRFNRFSLALGMGYDLGHDPDIKDFYFCFAYPFLVNVKGYGVSVDGLSNEERIKNLEMLRFIGKEAKRRGLHFQIGLWTHAYELEDSPNIQYKVEGLNEQTHAAYCRDALRTLLVACPEIDGVTIRVHYESGIPEPAHLFWKVVLEGISSCGRDVHLDLHPKGMYEELLQVADENGVPYTISPKFWAEHMGLPYHQAAIRETELPVEPTPEAGNMIITTTSRRFTRYGYADFFKEDRNYDIFFRIWPGTQRVLLWGDPEMAAAYGRAGSFCGAKGIELMEPLSFKSRKTTETNTGRDPYIDSSLRLDIKDWKKYLYSYRLWGRLLYNPESNPEVWRRYLRSEFKDASAFCEDALKHASRILPLLTVAHSPSVANNNYWPEIYSNIFIIDQEDKPDYHCDGREPNTFNEVSPLDPALFYRVDEFTEAMMENHRSGKLSPLETASLLEKNALQANEYLRKAKQLVKEMKETSFRRLAVDVQVQIGLGLFFANKFRAGTAYAFYEKVGDQDLLERALGYYKLARDHWEQIVEVTKDVYTNDITFGYVPFMRGHWADRLAGIEEDIQNMEKQKDKILHKASTVEIQRAKSWLLERPRTEIPLIEHKTPTPLKRGNNITISVKLDAPLLLTSIQLNYRRANQAESFQKVKMQKIKDQYIAEIPASYTDSPYPLVYFFDIENNQGQNQLYPGFDENLSNQPYFVIQQSK